MKSIERSGPKPNFSPWRLGDQKGCGGGEGEVSHGGGGSSQALEATGHRRWRWGAENHRPSVRSEREREEFEERVMAQKFKYPGHVPGQTLSGLAVL
jgi:hypothetical protein